MNLIGKTGFVTEALKNLSKLSIEEKKIQGKALNNNKLTTSFLIAAIKRLIYLI